MKILTPWLRSYLPALPVDDAQLAEDLTLRGIAVEGIFPVAHGSVFDMDITTNRVDAMNHYGIAREIAAIYNVPLAPLLDPGGKRRAEADDAAFPVRIDAPDLCGRFTAQVLRDVRIAPSDGMIAAYFKDLGVKPISNAVDISNFVLLGMGHPSHVFDLDKIDGGIVVRRAHAGESLKLLDGTTRTLLAEDLVIADHSRAISLAGVMGGFDTMITAETRNILIEAAWFSPAAIRATSRRHLIHTDASHRYERGADFAAPPVASALVAEHLLAACGGSLGGSLVDLVVAEQAAVTVNRPPVALSIFEVQRMLGTTLAPEGITSALVEQFLSALGCVLTFSAAGSWQVRLPSWRLDLARDIDLIEEIARVYGYNRFANTLPTPGVVVAHPLARAERALKSRLLALGFSEAVSSSFASATDATLFAPGETAVALENPLSEEHAAMRPSLLPGIVAMLAHNLARDVRDVRLFESGAIFSGDAAEVDERLSLSLGLTGESISSNLYLPADAAFFELKGALESLLSLFETPAPMVSAESVPPAFEPGRCASVLLGDFAIAHFGQLAAGEATRRKLRQPVFLAELSLEALLAYPLRQPVAYELSRFQAVERDFSFTFPDSVTWGAISSALGALRLFDMQSLKPVENWRDEKKYPGVFSMLIRIVFQSPERTLTDDDLSAWSAAIIHALQGLGGQLRA